MDGQVKPSRAVVLVLGLITLVTYSYVHQKYFDNSMALSRLNLLQAIVLDGTFAIDNYHENTVDKAFFDGHYYCDKAPGVVTVAFPFYYIAWKALSWEQISVLSPKGKLLSSWFCVAGSIGPITALGVICLFLWLCNFMPQFHALLSSLVFAFGCVTFPFATTLVSQALTAGLFAIALWSLRLGVDPGRAVSGEPASRWRDVIAGVACGLAIASEYTSALVAGGILIAVFFERPWRAGRLVLGAIGPLLLIPLYNWICLGNPFSLLYQHEAVFTQMDQGFFGIHAPSPDNFFYLLLSPHKGLLFWTPFLLVSVVGFRALYKRSQRLFSLCYAVPIIHMIVVSGYFHRDAGPFIGPRFFTPILPLLILPAGMGIAKLPKLATLLGIYSITIVSAATFVTAQSPIEEKNPLFNFYLWEVRAGHFSHNIGEMIGLPGGWSIAPLLIIVFGGIGWVCYQIHRQTCVSQDRTIAPAMQER